MEKELTARAVTTVSFNKFNRIFALVGWIGARWLYQTRLALNFFWSDSLKLSIADRLVSQLTGFFTLSENWANESILEALLSFLDLGIVLFLFLSVCLGD